MDAAPREAAMAGRMLKRNAALLILLAEAGAVVLVVYFLIQLDFLSVAWALSVAVAIPAWLLAVKAPTTCGVTTQKGGRCPRPVNGVIFGCGTSNHTWAKFFSRFGWRRQPDPNAAVRTSRSTVMPIAAAKELTGEGQMVVVRIAEDFKSRAAFWLALTATLCALVSATVDATNFAKATNTASDSKAYSYRIIGSS
jgi:hypothetical protein